MSTYFTATLQNRPLKSKPLQAPRPDPRAMPPVSRRLPVNKRKRARLQFLTWAQDNYPELYQAAVARAERAEMNGKLNGLGEDEQPSFWERVTENITKLGTTYLTLKNQRDAMALNMERARQGLPPVDAGVTAPVVRTQIDLPPEMIDRVTREAGIGLNKILLVGAAAFAAFMLMRKR